MSTETYVAGSGQGLTWGNAITGSNLNSLASGNSILSDIQIDNSTNLDMYGDVSISLASSTFASGGNLKVYLLPLNQDASTYGDGRFGSAASGQEPTEYLAGTVYLINGTGTNTGSITGILLPPGKFKFCFGVFGGALAASGNVILYRTYNRKVA